MLKIETTDLPTVLILTPRRFGDDRGYFFEVFNRDRYRSVGIDLEFVQDNFSLSRDSGTVRGLHFQLPPYAQDKLVWCPQGAVLDVAVDLRQGSPTFGRHVAVELSAANGRQLLIPIGFAHGFCTLEPNTSIAYKVSNVYSPAHDRGVAWDDPDLAIAWPVASGAAVLSAKDRAAPRLAALAPVFEATG